MEAVSRADVAVPYLGGVIEDIKPDAAAFIENIDAYYKNYSEVSSVNYFFGDCLKPNAAARLAVNPTKAFPPYVKSIGDQCNVIISESGGAVAIDCGAKNIHGIRTYVGGMYLGQKFCYITNKK